MPQLNTSIYFHEYGWLFISFFIFYFVFLKYCLPELIYWMKLKNNSLVYYLNFLLDINFVIKNRSKNTYSNYVYRALLNISLISKLDHAFSKKKGSNISLFNFNVERTVFNTLIAYTK